MEIVNATSFTDLIQNACLTCESRVCSNLIITGQFPYSEVDSDVVATHKDLACEWQSDTKPEHLFINHGEYINKDGDGKRHIIDELVRKRDTNRAIISLINMKNIIGSGDNPIPSFMILQMGFNEYDYSNLIITAYFRAIEVTKFLPINLTEISFYIKEAKAKFSEIKTFDLTIHSFKAYARKHFNCLRKSTLDVLDWTVIAKAVSEQNLRQIREWMYSKLSEVSSVIYCEGIQNLYKSFETWSEIYNKEIIKVLGIVLKDMKKLENIRKVSSHSIDIFDLEKRIHENLKIAIQILDEEPYNGYKRNNGSTT